MSIETYERDDNINGEVYIGGGETDAISFFAETAEILQKNIR